MKLQTPSIKQYNRYIKKAVIIFKSLDDMKLIVNNLGDIVGICNRNGDKQYFTS